ncbi:MAG: hypothetical protein MUC49_21205 [Raineya sp.]|jgi:hypothetical protein|nr:hypothetical protein [Raineya sp.]
MIFEKQARGITPPLFSFPLHLGKPKFTLIEENENKDALHQDSFWTGYFSLSPEQYQEYLTRKADWKILKEDLVADQKSLLEIETRLLEHKKNYPKIYEPLTKIEEEIGYRKLLRDDKQADLQTLRSKIESVYNEQKTLKNKSSFLQGVIFLVAGIIFLLGDLVVSHEIVAYALNIKNNLESWSFALGLAMVSILLKPAYDRLIEHPYLFSSSKRTKLIYAIFKIFLVFFVIGTITVLGYFRYEAYKAEQLKVSLQVEFEQLEGKEVENANDLLLKYNELSRSLVESKSSMFAFVLSGIMFAIAGAVCLGIGFPILIGYIRLWFQLPMTLKKLLSLEGKEKKLLEVMLAELFRLQAEQKAQANLLVFLGDITALETERATIEKRIHQTRNLMYHIQTNIKKARFAIAYQKGLKAHELENTSEQKTTVLGFEHPDDNKIVEPLEHDLNKQINASSPADKEISTNQIPIFSELSQTENITKELEPTISKKISFNYNSFLEDLKFFDSVFQKDTMILEKDFVSFMKERYEMNHQSIIQNINNLFFEDDEIVVSLAGASLWFGKRTLARKKYYFLSKNPNL